MLIASLRAQFRMSRRDIGVSATNTSRPSLEEVYLHVIGDGTE